MVVLDLVTLPVTRSGFIGCLTAIDHFSKYAYAVPIKNKTADTVIRALEERILPIMPLKPEKILSDNGPEFAADAMKQFLRSYGIQHVYITPLCPSSNGAIERFHRTFEEMLRCSVLHPTMWDKELPRTMVSYNNSWHSALNTAPANFILEHAHSLKPRLTVKESWKEADPRFESFAEGDLVLKATYLPGNLVSNKFKPRFSGPYRVLKVNRSNGVTYELENLESGVSVRAHHRFLRPYSGPRSSGFLHRSTVQTPRDSNSVGIGSPNLESSSEDDDDDPVDLVPVGPWKEANVTSKPIRTPHRSGSLTSQPVKGRKASIERTTPVVMSPIVPSGLKMGTYRTFNSKPRRWIDRGSGEYWEDSFMPLCPVERSNTVNDGQEPTTPHHKLNASGKDREGCLEEVCLASEELRTNKPCNSLSPGTLLKSIERFEMEERRRKLDLANVVNSSCPSGPGVETPLFPSVISVVQGRTPVNDAPALEDSGEVDLSDNANLTHTGRAPHREHSLTEPLSNNEEITWSGQRFLRDSLQKYNLNPAVTFSGNHLGDRDSSGGQSRRGAGRDSLRKYLKKLRRRTREEKIESYRDHLRQALEGDFLTPKKHTRSRGPVRDFPNVKPRNLEYLLGPIYGDK